MFRKAVAGVVTVALGACAGALPIEVRDARIPMPPAQTPPSPSISRTEAAPTTYWWVSTATSPTPRSTRQRRAAV
jgi:hypothetical protein